MIHRELLKRAWQEGRAADFGTLNPYYGTRAPACMRRHGYRNMLVDMLKTSPAAQRFEALRRVEPGGTR